MKRAMLVLALLLVGCAEKKPLPAPVALAPENRVTLHLCSPADESPECVTKLAMWDRKKHIEELVPLLLNDFRNKTTINTAEREHENAIMLWLIKHSGD